MKSIKFIIYTVLSFLILIGCTEEDESFKDLNTQVFVYPITIDDDGNVDKKVELALNESASETITMRIAIHPTQSTSTTVSWDIRNPIDNDTLVAELGKDFEYISDNTLTIPANQDFVDASFRIINDPDPESAEEFVFYLTDAGDRTLLEGSRQYRFTIRRNDDDVKFFFDGFERPENDTILTEGMSSTITVQLQSPPVSNYVVDYDWQGSAINGEDYTTQPNTTSLNAGETEFSVEVDLFNDDLEFHEDIDLVITRISHDNGFLILDENAGIDVEDNSFDPAINDLLLALAWTDSSSVNLDLTLWEDTGIDTIQVATSNNLNDFENILIESTQSDGDFLVTVSWVSGTDEITEVQFLTYIASNGYNTSNRRIETIEEDDMLFVYKIEKAGILYNVSQLDL